MDSLVDESTKHQLGDSLKVKSNNYIVVRITESEHIDYSTIIRVNELVKAPSKDVEEALF